MPLLQLDALRNAPLNTEPFLSTIVTDFIRPEDAQAIRADFPRITSPGLLPVEATQYGPVFGRLIDELRSEDAARAFSDKFGIDLVGRSTMITVRGFCQAKDGRIHSDSKAKLATALLYFNDPWDASGGRLRLLRRQDSLEDMIAEVPPDSGTLVAFKVAHNSWHGHEPFVGPRRYVMVNWMASSFSAQREIARHHLSAFKKRLFPATMEAAS